MSTTEKTLSTPRTVEDYLGLATRVLEDSTHIFEDHDNEQEAHELMALVLDVDEDDLNDEEPLSKRDGERFLSMVARRAGGEPLPFITGRIEFWGLELKVKPGPFVPRPSSELTVDRAVKKLRKMENPVVVDVATGAGPIALAIADDVPTADVYGTDIAEDGLRLGRENARRLEIDNVRFLRGDMYGALPNNLKGSVDLITGHVPYVPLDELDDLPSEVRDYEPVHTLSDRSDDGLGLMRVAIAGAGEWLRPGGWLLLEMSDDLPDQVTPMLRHAGLEPRGVASDDDDLSVVVEAKRPRPSDRSAKSRNGRAAKT
jgi:release factor glutamine methyltransferase